MGRNVAIAAIVGAACFAFGCGGGSSSTGQIRFVQASVGQPLLNLLIDGKTQASDLGYGNASDYISEKAGTRRVQVVPVNATAPVFTLSVPITDSGNTTVVMTGPTSGVKSLVLSDGGTAAVTGDGDVRVINASINMVAADIYLIPAGSSLNGAKPVATGVGFDGNPGYQPVPAGDYEVVMTSPGTQNILLDTGPININASDNWTLVVLDGTSGGFTFTQLKDQ